MNKRFDTPDCHRCKVPMAWGSTKTVGSGEQVPVQMEIYQCPSCGQLQAQPVAQVGE